MKETTTTVTRANPDYSALNADSKGVWNGGASYRDAIDVLYDLVQHYGKQPAEEHWLWREAQAIIERQLTWGWTPKNSHLVPLSALGREPE